MFTFTPSRASQPHQRDDRTHTPQLAAMLLGRPLMAPNPMDHQRQMAQLARLLLGR